MEAVPAICHAIGLEYHAKKVWDSPAVRFDPDCIAAVRAGTERAGFSSRDMVSGAGHDAAYIARVAPTTMIFVPCAGGLSHNEAGIDELRGMRRRRAGAPQRGAALRWAFRERRVVRPCVVSREWGVVRAQKEAPFASPRLLRRLAAFGSPLPASGERQSRALF